MNQTVIELGCGVTLTITHASDGMNITYLSLPLSGIDYIQFFADLLRAGIITRSEALEIVQALISPIQ